MAQVKAELEQFNDQMCDQVEMLMAQREELGQRLQQAEARARRARRIAAQAEDGTGAPADPGLTEAAHSAGGPGRVENRRSPQGHQ